MLHRNSAVLFVLVLAATSVSACVSGGRGRRPEPLPVGASDSGAMASDGGTTTPEDPDAGVGPGSDAGITMECSKGLVSCGGECVDTSSDNANCGRCGASCEGTCEGGTCSGIVTCSPPMVECGESGCVDLSSNPFNCGECGRACSAGATCDSGECLTSPVCPGGLAMCGDSCVDLSTSTTNCGTCGRVCGGGESCSGGTCRAIGPTCSAPMMMCGGICTDTSTSTANCGACGRACGAGQFCSGGSCTCTTGSMCSGSCRDTSTDPSNCGVCGRVCGAGTTCRVGVCAATGGGAGDTCATAIALSGSSSTMSFRLDDAAGNVTRSCGSAEVTPDRAFAFRPTRTGTATFAASGVAAATDLVIEVFSSSSCTTTTSMACNDDRVSGDLRPLVTMAVTAGVTYYVVVASYYDPAPAESMTLTVTAP